MVGCGGGSGTYSTPPQQQQQQCDVGGSYSARSARAYSVAAPLTIPNPTIAQPAPLPVATVPTFVPLNQSSVHESAAQAEEQSRPLKEATRRVIEAAYYMHRAMDAEYLSLTLDKAAAMLSEWAIAAIITNAAEPTTTQANVNTVVK